MSLIFLQVSLCLVSAVPPASSVEEGLMAEPQIECVCVFHPGAPRMWCLHGQLVSVEYRSVSAERKMRNVGSSPEW